jgi:hypothetical protein
MRIESDLALRPLYMHMCEATRGTLPGSVNRCPRQRDQGFVTHPCPSRNLRRWWSREGDEDEVRQAFAACVRSHMNALLWH